MDYPAAGSIDYRLVLTWSRMRTYMLARLALGPASLHTLYMDMMRLVDEGLLPAAPRLVELVDELSLYERLGLVAEHWGYYELVPEALPDSVAVEVEAAAARLAEVLGAWEVPVADSSIEAAVA